MLLTILPVLSWRFLGILATWQKLKPKFPNQFVYQNTKNFRYYDHVSQAALDFIIKIVVTPPLEWKNEKKLKHCGKKAVSQGW